MTYDFQLTYISIILANTLILYTLIIEGNDYDTLKKLENEKTKILEEIKETIDIAKTELNATDSEERKLIETIKELTFDRKVINESIKLNDSEILTSLIDFDYSDIDETDQIRSTEHNITIVDNDNDEARRYYRPSKRTTLGDMWNLKKIFAGYKKKKLYGNQSERYRLRQLMKKRFEAWYADRVQNRLNHQKRWEKERKDIKLGKKEKCVRDLNNKKRPCCRKCCKQSYLGCL